MAKPIFVLWASNKEYTKEHASKMQKEIEESLDGEYHVLIVSDERKQGMDIKVFNAANLKELDVESIKATIIDNVSHYGSALSILDKKVILVDDNGEEKILDLVANSDAEMVLKVAE